MFVLIYLVLALAYCQIVVYATKQPVSLAESSKSFLKPALGAAAVAGLVVGKQIINGPDFKEPVSLQGKNIVITGANTGLGKATAMKLAGLGGNVVMLCKSAARGEAAAQEVKASTGNSLVKAIQMDLSDLSSVRKGVEQLRNELPHIDVLVNNAGVMAIPTRTTTQDGFEAHIGINHLGHFALTGQLLELLKKSPGSDRRVVNVASQAHLFGDIDQTNLMLDRPGSYQPWPAYGNSKLANILFTKELARRLKEKGGKGGEIIAVSCHPGLCRTELGRYMFDMDSFKVPDYLNPLAAVVGSPIWYVSKSSEEGAQTQIFLSASSKLTVQDGGKFFDNSAPTTPSEKARDMKMAKWLFDESERLTGVKYEI